MFRGRGLPDSKSLSFCFAKMKVTKEKGDPGCCVPSLRYGQPAVLGKSGVTLKLAALKQSRALIRFCLRSSAHSHGGSRVRIRVRGVPSLCSARRSGSGSGNVPSLRSAWDRGHPHPNPLPRSGRGSRKSPTPEQKIKTSVRKRTQVSTSSTRRGAEILRQAQDERWDNLSTGSRRTGWGKVSTGSRRTKGVRWRPSSIVICRRHPNPKPAKQSRCHSTPHPAQCHAPRAPCPATSHS